MSINRSAWVITEIENNKMEISYQVPSDMAERIMAIANQSDTAILLILLSGVMYFLTRFTNDLAATAVIPAFNGFEAENMPKHFLKIDSEIHPQYGFREWLLRVKEDVSTAKEITEPTDWPATHVWLNTIHNGFDLNTAISEKVFAFYREENKLELKLYYDPISFNARSAAEFTEQWGAFMQTALYNPDQPLAQISVLSLRQQNQLLNDFNNTFKAYDINLRLHHWIEEQAVARPAKIAIYCGRDQLSYYELNAKANQLAHTLLEKGVKPDQPVAVIAERSFSMVIAIMAILKAGGAYLPIDPQAPLERIRFMLKDSQTNLVLYNHKNTQWMTAISPGLEFLDLDNPLAFAENRSNLNCAIDSHNLAYVIYTSGSTGVPKGVMVEHRSVINRLQWMQKQYPLTSEDVILQKTPFTFDVSVWELFWWSAVGAAVCLLEPGGERDLQEIIQAIDTCKVTVMHFVPSMLSLFLDYVELPGQTDALLSLKRVFTSGEALQVQHVNRFKQHVHLTVGTELINLYGPTEATVDVTYYNGLQASEALTVPIGSPIDNTRIYIVNEGTQLQPIGVVGELCIAGDGVARGYINRPDLTLEKFVADPFVEIGRMYRTGDLACWLADGSIEYKGRIDFQVKIRGNRIECGEIEHQLLTFPAIREAVVTAINNLQGDSSICAYVVSDGQISQAEISRYLAVRLPDYMIPAFMVQLGSLPLTANGKIDRAALPSPRRELSVEAYIPAFVDETERIITQLWCAELGVKQASGEDNFFLFGGDSIKVIRLISQINNSLQIQLKSRELYKQPTLAYLIELVRNKNSQNQAQIMAKGYTAIQLAKEKIIDDPDQLKELPGDWEDIYPLSSIQQSMVFYSRMKPNEPIYHDQFCYSFNIPQFESRLFQQTLQLLIQKHPIMRTTFILSKFSEAMQVVHKHLDAAYIYEDISDQSQSEQEAHIKSKMEEDLTIKYKFEAEALWRMQLYRVDDISYCMVLSFHHAVLDGWSVAAFINEFVEIYSRLSKEGAYEATPLKSSYRDYVAEQLSHNSTEDNLSFWKAYLADYTRNKLPFNYANKKLQTLHTNQIIRKRLDSDFLQLLENKALSLSCTLKELCLAAHLYLLSIISTENDVVTGLVTHDRPDLADSEKVLGCFLNTIPFRHKVEKQFNKLAFIAEITLALRKAKPNELFLADIAAATGERNIGENPFFDTLFNFIDMHVLEELRMSAEASVQATTHELNIISNEMTNTLFDLEVSKTLSHLDIQLKYSPNYFHATEMTTALDLYINILGQFASEQETIDYESCLLEEQTEKSLYGFNQTQTEFPEDKTLHQLFENQAKLTPNQIALTFQNLQMTYGELDRKSNQLASLLINKGVQVNDHVGLFIQRGMDMIVAMLAILKCGAAYVPMDPEFPNSRIDYLVNNASITTVVTDQAHNWTQPVKAIIYAQEQIELHSPEPIKINNQPSDLAYIIYTSGSTGMPKGVMIEHRSAVNLVHWVNREFDISAKDSLLFITSMCFDLSVYDVFGILAAGGRVVIADKTQLQSPLQLKKLIEQEAITFWDSVPTTMNHLLQFIEETDESFRQTSLRLLFMSGDWIPVNLMGLIKKHFPNAAIIGLGGATEATVWSNYYRIEQITELQSSVPYGKPIGNNYYYILDETLKPLPEGVAGELYIGGIGVARGYMADSARSAKAFLNNPYLSGPAERIYKTGDVGRMLPDGNMEFLGRKDHQVKIRGYRVELGEIESQLSKLSPIKEACVMDLTDAHQMKYLCAYIVSDQAITLTEIKEKLLQVLPGYMIPSVVMQVPQLPLTANGKIDRAVLPEPTLQRGDETQYEPPRNELDQKLLEMWGLVLNIEKIGIRDNFFELGGHSLLAVKLEIEVEKYTSIAMDMFTFNYQTILEQSDYLQKMGEANETNL